MMLSPPSTRIALGSIVIGGQRFELFLSPEWARYFESLNTQVVDLGSATDQAMGFAAMMGESSGEIEGPAGPPGLQGPQGDAGLAVFMLQEVSIEQEMPMRPGQDPASGFGCNGKAAQGPAVSGGTLAGVIAALVANGILSS